ncbi:XrtA/PEP-CTERM system TPR-repeat protein PrsT [Zoogloea sp.]|uniref:XrtA/PEP-CTERM system TPR-repeat protein PrsT n=1 Tax=Zoogloea sp. TaxID=49181 RepID=UPI0035B19CB7
MTEKKQQTASCTKPARVRKVVLSSLCAFLLAACGASPESMLGSAKEYLAKNDKNAAAIQLKNALQKEPRLAEARYLLGKIYFEQGDFASAEKEFQRALDAGYAVDDVVPQLAKALLLSGQPEKVTGELSSHTLSKAEARADFITQQGYAWLAQKKLETAAESFRSALQAQPGFPAARIGQARLKAQAGDQAAAFEAVSAILQEHPDLVDGHVLRANLFQNMAKPEEAIAELEKVLVLRPNDLLTYQGLITLLLRVNKLDAAQQKVDELKKSVGSHPLTSYFQAYLDNQRGKADQAYENVQQALRQAPDYLPALMLAAALQLQRQDFVQAQANLAKALERAPNLDPARKMLVSAYIGLKEPTKALEVLQPLVKGRTEDPTLLALAGQVYAINGDFTRSEDYYQQAAKADPKNAQYRTRLAASRLASGSTEQGLHDLAAASALDANDVQPDIALVMAHLRRNEGQKALAALQALEKKKPNDPVTLNLKGGVMLSLKDAAAARKAFEQALAIKPDLLPAVINLARLDAGDKKPEAGRQRYQDFLAKNPKVGQAYLQYAEYLSQTGGTPPDVKAVLEKGLTLAPDAIEIRMALARMLAQSGDTKRALSLAQEAAAATPDDPAVMELLGRAQVAAGELQQALSTFSKLSARLPNSPTPFIAMADVQAALKNAPSAEQSLRKALSVKPDMLDAQQRLVALMVDAKRFDAALGVVREVQKQKPKQAVGFGMEAEVFLSQGRRSEAVAAYTEAYKREKLPQLVARLYALQQLQGQQAEAARILADWLKANPKDMLVRGLIADQNLAQSQFEQAAVQYRAMLEQNPKNVMVMNNLAWTLGKLKDKGAIPLAQQALALAPSSAVVLDTLGTLQVENGQLQPGVENLKKAVSLSPNQPQLRVNLAKALIQAGRKSDAKTELETALKNAPEKSPLRAEIDKLKATL